MKKSLKNISSFFKRVFKCGCNKSKRKSKRKTRKMVNRVRVRVRVMKGG